MKRAFPNLFPELRRASGRRLRRRAAQGRCSTSRPTAATSPTSCCSRRASTTAPISSTASSRGRWAFRSSKGRDLVVRDSRVYMRTTAGLVPVDVIYRRIDDDFLDPTGLPARFAARCARPGERLPLGQCRLANTIGTGVADDKVIYYFVPRIIKYYLGEDPILPNVEHLSRDRRRPTGTTSSKTSRSSW